MLHFILPIVLLVSSLANADPLRVRFNPTVTQVKFEPDWANWTFVNGASSYTTTMNGVTATVSSSTTFTGGYWAIVYRKFEAYLGERVAAEGISTGDKSGVPISLSLEGLSVGEHTLLSYHNSWDDIVETTPIDVSVNGEVVLSNVTQTIRQDNVWTSGSSYFKFNVSDPTETITIIYTPQSGTAATDKRLFLNGIEIDTGNMKEQASFPYPERQNKYIDADDGNIIMTWKPPTSGSSSAFSYTLYIGESPTTLNQVYSGAERTFNLNNVSSLKTYYWRVDVTAGETRETTTGMVWVFRSRVLAFPGAEGYGKWARGGRGGAVVKVTSLADSGVGSLRWALTQNPGPKTVIFDIGGVITLNSRIQLTEWDREITIAGQTAPGKGIAVTGWPIGISSSADIVFQHMRVRPGKVSGQTVDGMGLRGGNNCIMDRCSMGWGIDESFSSRDSFNITFQRSFISEPLNVAGHANYPPGTEHGFAASIGGDIGSFHHNLLAHAEGRSWSLAGGVDANAYFQGRLDIRNNVVYNFGDRTTDGGAHQVNFINNYYKPGPSSTRHYTMMAQYEDSLPGTQTYHCEGNMMFGLYNSSDTQWVESPEDQSNPSVPCWPKVTINPAPAYQKYYETSFFDGMVTTHAAADAYKIVLSDSGASSPVQDDHDARIVNETITNLPLYKGSVSGKIGIIDNEADVGGLESFPTTVRQANWDADNDGIADWWDGSTGGVKGWTAIDGYLAFMSDPHYFVKFGSSVSIPLSNLATGFANPKFTITGASKGLVAVIGTKAKYVPSKKSGIERLTLKIVDDEGTKWSRLIGVAIWDKFE
ncbi:pectate lyase [Flagelloscypha sp. PMI_526]|nr:pectate lyase [Flagelloscypha sp. PMI_526]